MNPHVSVVIPVFNSEATIPILIARLDTVFLTEQLSYEIILVNDGSVNPSTQRIILEVTTQHKDVIAINLTRNFGQQAATICGILHARGNVIITMDDDLQHLPEEIPKLLKFQDHDVVIGEFANSKQPLKRRIFSRIKNHFDYLILGKPKNLTLSAFRLFRRSIVDVMAPLLEVPYPFLPAIFFYTTRDVVGVPVEHNPRYENESGYSMGRLLQLFGNLVINNSSILLRIVGNLGLVISAISIILSVYFIFRKFMMGTSVVGWTSVIVAILFIGGVLLFSVGIIGEYLIRIIRGLDGRPNYIIREKVINGKTTRQ